MPYVFVEFLIFVDPRLHKALFVLFSERADGQLDFGVLVRFRLYGTYRFFIRFGRFACIDLARADRKTHRRGKYAGYQRYYSLLHVLPPDLRVMPSGRNEFSAPTGVFISVLSEFSLFGFLFLYYLNSAVAELSVDYYFSVFDFVIRSFDENFVVLTNFERTLRRV